MVPEHSKGSLNLSVFTDILNFCANNYLGLSSHPEVVKAGIEALQRYGAGLSSVRFICGTQVTIITSLLLTQVVWVSNIYTFMVIHLHTFCTHCI